MMLPSIGEIVTRYGKIIFAFWTVVTLVMIAPAWASLQDSPSSFTEMDEDYTRTMEYISVYFDKPQLDYSKTPILAIRYDSADGYRQLMGNESIGLKPFTDYLYDRFSTDDKWDSKLNFGFGGVTYLDANTDGTTGMFLVCFNYYDSVSENERIGYTDDLRASIEKYRSDYMYELYEKDCHFDTFLTGQDATSYDTYENLMFYAIIAAIVTIIFSLIIMGLFFGSAMTSIITTITVTISGIVTVGVLGLISKYIDIPLEFIMIVAIVTVIVSVMHCILIISAYRRRILAGKDRKESLKETSVLSTKLILITSACTLIVCIVLMLSGSKIMFTEGLCIGTGVAVVCLVSSTVPSSLIYITKNEMFWMRTKDRRIRWVRMEKVYSFIDNGVKNVTKMTSNRKRRTDIIVVIVLIALLGSSLAYVISANSFSGWAYDMDGMFATGESKEGTDVMRTYGDGGLTNPYEVVIEFDHPIGYIERENIILGISVMTVKWNTGDYLSKINSLKNDIYYCDTANVNSVESIVRWADLVYDAKESGLTDYDDIIDYARASLRVKDWTAAVTMDIILDDLMDRYSSAFIVEYLGPVIDYDLNESLGAIGYHMDDSKNIVIDRVMLRVYTADTASSSASQKTSEKVDRTVSEFVKTNNDVKGAKCVGLSSAYNSITKEINSKYLLFAAISLILVFIVMAVAERKILFTAGNFISSIIGMSLSAAIVTFISAILNNGNQIYTILFVIPLMCVILCTWFGCMQCYCGYHYRDIGKMRKTVDPIIIITTVLLTVFALFMSLTDMKGIYMIAITAVVTLIIEGLFIRIVISPSLWKLMNISFEEKKEEETEGQ